MARRHEDWIRKWLGRAWVEGEYECGHFTAEVMREEFGRRPTAKSLVAHSLDEAAGAPVRERDAAWRALLGSAAARRVEGLPEEGDAILMRAGAGVRIQGYHLGVLALGRRGEPYCLHLAPDAGSILTAIDRLDGLGYALEGYYRWA